MSYDLFNKYQFSIFSYLYFNSKNVARVIILVDLTLLKYNK